MNQYLVYNRINRGSVQWNEFHKNIFSEYQDRGFETIFHHLGKCYKVRIYKTKKDRAIISLMDITKEHEKTEDMVILFDSVPAQIWYLKDASTYLSANRAHAGFIGIDRADFREGSIKSMMDKKKG